MAVKVLSFFLCTILLITTVSILSCASKPAAQSRQGTLVLDPTSGEPGAKIKFNGSGFIPGEKVRVVLNDNGVTFSFGTAGTEQTGTGGGVAVVDQTGTFTLGSQGGIPAALQPGSYTVEAIGDKSTKAAATLVVVSKKK